MMNTKRILDLLMVLSHEPLLVFANQIDEKTDNTFETLRLLSKEKQVTAGRISTYLDIKPSSVTQIIKKLEETGMAVRVKSKEDARVVFVELTEKGKEALKERGAIFDGLNESLFQGFSEAELENLGAYLEKIRENISSESFKEKINVIFGDDQRWQQFSKMSAHFGRAREQMMERGRHRGGGIHGAVREMFQDGVDDSASFFDRRKR